MSIHTVNNASNWKKLRLVVETFAHSAGWEEKSVALGAVATIVSSGVLFAHGHLSLLAVGLITVWVAIALTWMLLAVLNEQLLIGLGQSVIDGDAVVREAEE